MIGGTVSTVGGLIKGIDNCIKVNFDTTQVYVTESRRWTTRLYMEAKAKEIKEYAEQKKVLIVAHVPFLVNLATADWYLANRSVERLKEEIRMCGLLGVKHLVIHPGSSVDGDEERALKQIIKGLNEVHPYLVEQDVSLLLETMSGMGTQYGTHPSHFEAIFDELEDDLKIGLCFDTAHVYAAGVDFDQYLDRWATKIGCFHLNNTKVKAGAKLDRHSSIFDGNIEMEVFEAICRNYPHLPKILEFNAQDKTGPEQVAHLKELIKNES